MASNIVKNIIPGVSNGTAAIINDFTFRNSNPNESSGIYTNWDNLISAMDSTPGRKRLFVEGATVNTSVKTGMDFQDIEIIGVGAGDPPVLNFVDGCTFATGKFPLRIVHAKLKFNNTSTKLVDYAFGGTYKFILENNASIENSGTQPVIQSTLINDVDFIIDMIDKSQLINDTKEIFDIANTNASLDINLFDNSSIDSDVIKGNFPVTVNIKSNSADYPPSQPNHSGVLTVNLDKNIVQMTTSEKTALNSPVNGLQVFDTTLGKVQVRESGSWVNTV